MSIRSFLSKLALLFACLGCDRIGESLQPAEEELVAPNNELVTLPNAPLIINPKLWTESRVPATYRLSRQPRSGTLVFTPKGFLLYTPDPSFVAGSDGFTIESDAAAPPTTFDVSMVPDAEQLPCGTAVAGDQAETPANTPVTMDVLRNDLFCDNRPDPASLQIETPPLHGAVRIDKGKVIYTPAKNSTGRDRFIYRVCPIGGVDSDCMLSVATVTVNEPVTSCRLVLQNDQVSFRQRFATDSLIIPVLANDQLCKANRLLPLTLSGKPAGGTAYLTTKNIIVYKPQLATTADKITYRRCEGGNCQEASVFITLPRPDAGCQLKANYNLVQLSLGQPTAAMRRGLVPIYVLGNDVLCAPLKSVTILKSPPGAALQVAPGGYINYTMEANPKPKEIIFTYQLADTQGRTSSATVKIVIKP